MHTIRGWATVDSSVHIMKAVFLFNCIGTVTKTIFISIAVYILNQHRTQLEATGVESTVLEGFRYIVGLC